MISISVNGGMPYQPAITVGLWAPPTRVRIPIGLCIQRLGEPVREIPYPIPVPEIAPPPMSNSSPLSLDSPNITDWAIFLSRNPILDPYPTSTSGPKASYRSASTPPPPRFRYVSTICWRASSGSASMSIAVMPSSRAARIRRLSAPRRRSHPTSLAADIWRASAS